MQLLMNTGPVQPFPEDRRSGQQFSFKHNHAKQPVPEENHPSLEQLIPERGQKGKRQKGELTSWKSQLQLHPEHVGTPSVTLNNSSGWETKKIQLGFYFNQGASLIQENMP